MVEAQEAGCALRLPTRVLELGEAVSAELVCTNTGRPELPEITTPDGLGLQITNSIPSQSTRMSWVNGRSSQRTDYSFPFRLTALKEGRYVIPPIEVVAGGRTFRTDPVAVTVQKTEAESAPKGDRLLWVELSVDREELYVTETLIATMVLAIRKVEIGGRVYNLDMLREVLDVRGSQLSVFAGGTASTSQRWLEDAQGQRHAYEVFRVTQEIQAEQAGPLQIGPVFLKARYPTSLRRGFFGGLEVAAARTETARADAITVDVKGPPLAGRPEHFTGAIGRFNIEVSAKPTHVEKGQPVTLSITISGDPIEGVAGPDLASHPELVSRFDFVGEELVGDVHGNSKVFRRAIFPKQEGNQTIPPVTWSYFDPRKEQYVTVRSEPIDIMVDPPSGRETIVLSGVEAPGRPSPTTLTVLSGGISPNYVDPSVVLATERFEVVSPVGLALLTIPPAFCLLVSVTAHRRARVRDDVAYARRRGARRRAVSAMRAAVAGRDGADRLQGVAAAFSGYLSDRFNLPPGRLTRDELQGVLADRGVDAETIREVNEFFEACEAGRFMPGANNALSPEDAARRAWDWIRKFEKSEA